MNIVIATTNVHKKTELEAILAGHSLLTPDELNVDYHFEETEDTFFGNAHGKAAALLAELSSLHDDQRYAALADDSGLVVPSLGGEPGVFSARYGSNIFRRMLSDEEKNEYLLQQMRGKEERHAFFVCSMVVLLSDYRMFAVQETFEGVIANAPSGDHGFGYDPLLYLPFLDKTAAELTPEEKNSISHRGKAARALSALLSQNTVI
ncbi:MAG: non-canonical purine NTP pyrophosphatase [Spirochaetota bacterium]